MGPLRKRPKQSQEIVFRLVPVLGEVGCLRTISEVESPIQLHFPAMRSDSEGLERILRAKLSLPEENGFSLILQKTQHSDHLLHTPPSDEERVCASAETSPGPERETAVAAQKSLE